MAHSSLNGSSPTSEPVLLKQYKLLGAVIDAPWATRLDHKIARHVIERYYAKFGNARASLRYLEMATGAERNKIIPSLRRIIEHGVISVIRQGIGTRPTEYDLNFDFALKAASGVLDGTSTSGAPEGTSRGAPEGTSMVPSGAPEGTQTYLRNMPTGMLTVGIHEDTPAVPTAPPASGLEADPAASAVDPGGFEELWAVFPRKHQRAKAQAAYRALAPSSALHDELVAKATAWASHYQQTGTERKWWKHLHTWLAEERYLEDLPEPYENPKEAAIARNRENGPDKGKLQTAPKDVGLSSKTPIGRHRVKIVGSEITGDSFSEERRLIFAYRIEEGRHEGTEFSHAFKLLSADENVQREGSAFFTQVRQATGLLEPGDTSDFHGKTLLATVKAMGRIEYAAQ
ncbi:hypothetical protein ACVIGB_002516 [Bradyrhizobium sp. USDA 4341]